MVVYLVKIYVKKGFEEAFIRASLLNKKGAGNEEGVVQFDLSRKADNSSEFLLYEVYASDEAVAFHKTTDHYLKWRETVEPMMEKPREGIKYSPVS